MKPKKQIVGVQNEHGAQAPGVIEMRDLLAISPAEAVFKAQEDTQSMHAVYRIPNQELLENQEMARGRVLDHQVFIQGLKLLDPKIQILPGGVKNAVQVRYPKTPEFPGDADTAYISGFYCEPLPEFSSVTTDAKGLPHREIRGWRSVLLALVTRNIITREQADVIFGPAVGQRSTLWHQSMQAQGKN